MSGVAQALDGARRVRPGDELALTTFYNGLGADTIRDFHPLGERAEVEVFRDIVHDDLDGARVDVVEVRGGRVVGWAFARRLDGDEPDVGIVVAERHRRRGVGGRLLAIVTLTARALGVERLFLNVVEDATVARRMYERRDFREVRRFVGRDDGRRWTRMSRRLDYLDAVFPGG